MKFRNRSFLIILVVVLLASGPLAAFAQLTPERVNAISRGRYHVADPVTVVPSSVFTQPEYNGDPKMLDGYGRKSARELGHAGKKVYNEYPGRGGVPVTLHDRAELVYDTASLEPKYLGGCFRNGRPWYNRIKLVEPALPPRPPEPRVVERIVERRVEVPGPERIVEKRVEVPGPERIVYRDRPIQAPQPCAACPKIDFDFGSSWVQRTPLGAFNSVGNVLELVASVATGGVSSYFTSHKTRRNDTYLRSGAYSAGAYMVANAINPEENRAKIFVEGREVLKGLKRGHESKFDGGRALWDRDGVKVLIPDGRGGEMLCGFAEPGRKVNFTPVVLADRVERGPVQLPPPPVVKPPGFPPPRPQAFGGASQGLGGTKTLNPKIRERVAEALRNMRP